MAMNKIKFLSETKVEPSNGGARNIWLGIGDPADSITLWPKVYAENSCFGFQKDNPINDNISSNIATGEHYKEYIILKCDLDPSWTINQIIIEGYALKSSFGTTDYFDGRDSYRVEDLIMLCRGERIKAARNVSFADKIQPPHTNTATDTGLTSPSYTISLSGMEKGYDSLYLSCKADNSPTFGWWPEALPRRIIVKVQDDWGNIGDIYVALPEGTEMV